MEELKALSGVKGHAMPKHHERAIRQASLPARMGGLGVGVLTTGMAAVAGMSSAAAALQRLRAEWGQQRGGEWLAVHAVGLFLC